MGREEIVEYYFGVTVAPNNRIVALVCEIQEELEVAGSPGVVLRELFLGPFCSEILTLQLSGSSPHPFLVFMPELEFAPFHTSHFFISQQVGIIEGVDNQEDGPLFITFNDSAIRPCPRRSPPK